jgi:hypothetical protein
MRQAYRLRTQAQWDMFVAKHNINFLFGKWREYGDQSIIYLESKTYADVKHALSHGNIIVELFTFKDYIDLI